MKRSLSGYVVFLLAGMTAACAAEPAPMRAAPEGIWQTEDDDMVLVFSADGTGKMMPADPAKAEGKFMAIRWACAADGRLEISGFPDGSVLRWRVTPGDPLILKSATGEVLTLKKLDKLPEPLAALKPVDPATLTGALTESQMLCMAANGRQVITAFLMAWWARERSREFDPREGESGADYFRRLAATGGFSLPASELAGPGYPAAATMADLKAENLAWRVMGGGRRTAGGSLPFLLSRNIRANTLGDLKGTILDTLGEDKPFGKQGAIVVFMDGHARILKGDELRQTWEAILDQPIGEADLARPILTP